MDMCCARFGKSAIQPIHAINLVPLQYGPALRIVDFGKMGTLPAAATLAGNLRCRTEIYTQAGYMENTRQQDAAMWATFEEKVALAENRMLLTASKKDGRDRGGAGSLEHCIIVDDVVRGTGV